MGKRRDLLWLVGVVAVVAEAAWMAIEVLDPRLSERDAWAVTLYVKSIRRH